MEPADLPDFQLTVLEQSKTLCSTAVKNTVQHN
jgi:hypothetical protein